MVKILAYMNIFCLSTQTVVNTSCLFTGEPRTSYRNCDGDVTPHANIIQYEIISLLMEFDHLLGEPPEIPPTENQTGQCLQAGQERNSWVTCDQCTSKGIWRTHFWVEKQMACLLENRLSWMIPAVAVHVVTRCTNVVVFTLSLYTLALTPSSPSVPLSLSPPVETLLTWPF